MALYFALPPAVSQKACEILAKKDLPAGTRLVMEKPFGSSTESAQAPQRHLGHGWCPRTIFTGWTTSWASPRS